MTTGPPLSPRRGASWNEYSRSAERVHSFFRRSRTTQNSTTMEQTSSKTYQIRIERITASTLDELTTKIEAVNLEQGESACSYELIIPIMKEL